MPLWTFCKHFAKMNKQLFIIHDVYNLNTQPNIQTHFEQKLYANFGENYADAFIDFKFKAIAPSVYTFGTKNFFCPTWYFRVQMELDKKPGIFIYLLFLFYMGLYFFLTSDVKFSGKSGLKVLSEHHKKSEAAWDLHNRFKHRHNPSRRRFDWFWTEAESFGTPCGGWKCQRRPEIFTIGSKPGTILPVDVSIFKIA